MATEMAEREPTVTVRCDNVRCTARFIVSAADLNEDVVFCDNCDGNQFTLMGDVKCPWCGSQRFDMSIYVPMNRRYDARTGELSIPQYNDLNTKIKEGTDGIMCECGRYFSSQLLSAFSKRMAIVENETPSHFATDRIAACFKMAKILKAHCRESKPDPDATLKKIIIALYDAGHDVQSCKK